MAFDDDDLAGVFCELLSKFSFLQLTPELRLTAEQERSVRELAKELNGIFGGVRARGAAARAAKGGR